MSRHRLVCGTVDKVVLRTNLRDAVPRYHLVVPIPSGQDFVGMNTAKSEVAEMLGALPENCSLEDIQYHLYVLEKIKRGVDRVQTEGAIPHAEAKTRLQRWLSN